MNQFSRRRVAVNQWSPQLVLDVANAPDHVSAATRLGDSGVPVFPCVPGGKRPLTPHGFLDASTELDVISSWWRREPEANIGIPTGSAGGIDVVDVDVHAGGSGYASLERARRSGLVEGWAWLVRTPSGGLHAYFLHTGQPEQRSWQVPHRHIDFRGDGGYIVVPPSRVMDATGAPHPYRLLAVAAHRPPQPVDSARLRALLDPPRPPRPPTDRPPRGSRPDRLAAWVASRPEGARNGGLFWAACRMAENGHTLSATAQLLGAAAQAAGLPEPEALGTIHSAYRIASRRGREPAPRATSPIQAVGL